MTFTSTGTECGMFEELDYRRTPLGDLILRRRTELSLGVEVYEVKLGDAFLMSSLFTAGEIALARHALSGLGPGPLDVVVGGLGLGYTARAVLDDPAVRSLVVVEALPDVIQWHCRALVPLGKGLVSDPRCELLDGDFFSLVKGPGLHPDHPDKRFHVIAVDIDHSPRDVLHPGHAWLYTKDGLSSVAAHLVAGGVFALWSDDLPENEFCALLDEVFASSEARVVRFANPLTGGESANTVYLARTAVSA